MEPVLFVMAILGCGESDAPCREIALARTHYQGEATCLAATEGELARQDALYPTLVAQCRRAGTAPRLVRGNEVMPPQGGVLPDQAPRYAAASRRTQPGT